MSGASGYLIHQNAYLFEVEELRTQVIASQYKVIMLQEELLSCKNEQLASVQAAVTSTVQETV